MSNALQKGASDLHLTPRNPPIVRINGRLEPLNGNPLSAADTEQLLSELLPRAGAQDVDSSVTVSTSSGPARFRASIYRMAGGWAACLRHIRTKPPRLGELGFPAGVAEQLCAFRDGLLIFSGATGAGKSSTMAGLIQHISDRTRLHVLTIEEPIEFVYDSRGGSLYSQREVGRDVASFADGLRHGLRQDPDVILVGETRDRETAQMALSAAETGHLVLTTLHTRDAKSAISRMVDLFPPDQQDEARKQLAMSLRAVVAQHLLPAVQSTAPRVLAIELLINSMPAESAIRQGKIESLESVLQTGRRDGSFALDDDLQRLVNAGRIARETARRVAKRPELFG